MEGEEPIEPGPARPARGSSCVHEDGAVRAMPLDKELVTIGRLAECDVVVDDTGASRRHAQVRTRDGSLDAHGPRLDERDEGERPRGAVRALADGDTITVGTTQIDYPERVVLAASVEPFALSALKYGLLGPAVPVHLAGDALGGARPDRRPQRPPPAQRGAATVTSRAPRACSWCIADGQKPWTYRLDGATTIGRAAECELRLDDTYVSQQHARIFDRNGNWYVEDLGSTNGTFVNEQKLVAPAMLTPGDKIRVGTTIVELRR